MSKQFQEYVTGIAFSLTLSKPMCDAMHFFVNREQQREKNGFQIVGSIPGLMTAQSLERRGLIERQLPATKNDFLMLPGRWCVTEAGFKVFDLLVLAGLCTNVNGECGVAA